MAEAELEARTLLKSSSRSLGASSGMSSGTEGRTVNAGPVLGIGLIIFMIALSVVEYRKPSSGWNEGADGGCLDW